MTGSPGGRHGSDEPDGWEETYQALAERRAAGELDATGLEQLAIAASFVGREADSDRAWEDAQQAWLQRGDADRAGRCAFWLAFALLLRGEGARASGWFARGERLVSDLGDGCAARGYLLIPKAMAALEEGAVDRCAELYREVALIGARFRDPDLEAIAILGQGEAAIVAGDTRTGIAKLDEAMVLATSGALTPMATGIMYCAVIDACMHVFDLRRAGEWTDALTRWCDGQRDVVPYRGVCLVHRSQVLQAHGAWEEALSEAAKARGRLADPPHPALGSACYQRAELHRLRGELDDAEQAYREASRHGRDPAPGVALLRLAQGRHAAASVAIQRMLAERQHQLERLAILPAFVEIMLATGDVDGAAAASDELSAIAAGLGTPLVGALADHARAGVLHARGTPTAALESARRACQAFRELAMPYDAARAQVCVAQACRALGDDDAADIELDAAAAALADLGARPDAAHAEALRDDHAEARRGSGAQTLTARECDVLRLVAGGLTNREIGGRLRISEHTVARHVQNIFAKLGVGSRAAATSRAHDLGVV